MRTAVALAAGLLLAGAAIAQSALPKELEEVGLEQRVGGALPLDLELVEHTGATARLGDFFADKPVVLAPVYFDCPMLCGLVLEGLVQSLRAIALEPGTDFEVLAVSFDATETAGQASAARSRWIERYGRAGGEDGLHFLTGGDAAIATLMDAIGFRFARDEESGEIAHVSSIVIVTPEGTVARYFPGVEYPPRDLRLSLVEAADERVGSVVDKVLLYCFKYDPAAGKYTAATMNLVRAGGLVTLLAMGGFVLLSLRRERRRQTAGARA